MIIPGIFPFKLDSNNGPFTTLAPAYYGTITQVWNNMPRHEYGPTINEAFHIAKTCILDGGQSMIHGPLFEYYISAPRKRKLLLTNNRVRIQGIRLTNLVTNELGEDIERLRKRKWQINVVDKNEHLDNALFSLSIHPHSKTLQLYFDTPLTQRGYVPRVLRYARVWDANTK